MGNFGFPSDVEYAWRSYSVKPDVVRETWGMAGALHPECLAPGFRARAPCIVLSSELLVDGRPTESNDANLGKLLFRGKGERKVCLGYQGVESPKYLHHGDRREGLTEPRQAYPDGRLNWIVTKELAGVLPVFVQVWTMLYI